MKTKKIWGGVSRKILKIKVVRGKILSDKGLALEVFRNRGRKESTEGQRVTKLRPEVTDTPEVLL